MWHGCGGLVLVPVLLGCTPMNTLNTIAIHRSCVGTRGGMARMWGPRACHRPVGLPTHEYPEYQRNRTSPQDKHKAPSLPLHRPLSLRLCKPSPKKPTCVSTPPFRRPLSLRPINPILFVLTQSPARNNISTLATYETANNLYAQSAYHSKGDRIEYVPDAFRRPHHAT